MSADEQAQKSERCPSEINNKSGWLFRTRAQMTLGEKREAKIHFGLHNAMKNVIQRVPRFDGVQFARTEPEYPVPGVGRADLVLFDHRGTPWLTIETKAAIKAGDPFSYKVIGQAIKYASALGSYYFATCDGRTLVLFDNREEGVPFWERKRVPPFDLSGKDLETVAESLLDTIVKLEEGTLKWSALDDAFVVRLKYLHNRLVPNVLKSLKAKIRESRDFRGRYEDWLKVQGFELEEDSNERTAIEAAYLLINKVLFYKVLETIYDLPKLRQVEKESEVVRALSSCFNTVKRIDYEAIYEQSIFDEISFAKESTEIVNDFLEEAAGYDLSKIESDVLGRIYEGLIPEDERRILGQYYTPPPICDLLVNMCVQNENDIVLDPGCGSGGFLIKAYYRLLRLKGKSVIDEKTHREILGQLFGIDISHFPAHISVINLALRHLSPANDKINILAWDFFKTSPEQETLMPVEWESIDEKKSFKKGVPQVDAVVCNPPYTRQDEIGSEKYRKSIRKVALAIAYKKSLDISKEAGIYAYFFTHSSHFLKEDGLMGYIVSNSWMDVRFGVALQEYFLDNFLIHSITEFDRRAFAEAAINTVNIVLKKSTGERKKTARDENVVKFVRVKKTLSTEEIVSRIEEVDKSYEKDDMKVTLIRQGDLHDDHKWLKFLRAPPIYFDLLNHPQIAPLSKLADVNVGIITYANQFFILKKKEARDTGIERRYLRPIATSPRSVKFLDLRPDDVSELLFYANEPKTGMRGSKAMGYIQWGESAKVEITRGAKRGFVRGYNNIPSFKDKPMWYSVGERNHAPILLPRLMWNRLFAIRNDCGCLANDRFYEIRPKDEKHVSLILGFLNSILGKMCMEACGRTTLGEGGLELMKYELDNFPAPNFESLTSGQRKMVIDGEKRLEGAVRSNDDAKIALAQDVLDSAVFEALDLGNRQKEAVGQAFEYLRDLRRGRVEVEVLVEHPEKGKPRPREQRQKNVTDFESRSRTLDEFGGS